MTLLDAGKTNPKQGGPSYSLRHRLFRVFWNSTWLLFGSWTPAPFHRWRIFLLTLFGAKIAKTAHIYGSARIWYPPNLTMADHSCLASHVNCYCMASITIGENAVVSQGAYLCAGMHDIDDPNFQLVVKPISIGSDAWVAAEAFVGPGVIIGSKAVIGARAVIFKAAEDRGVYAGNPAKLIRYRNP